MNSNDALIRGILVGAVLLITSIWSGIGQTQDSVQSLRAAAERERLLLESIEAEQLENGPYSETLIGLLTSLHAHYDEIGEPALADAMAREIRQVIRANYGLYSLEQAPTIRLLMLRELERGNIDGAWDLEQELLGLVSRNLDDVRSARILSDVGDRRLDILERYDEGEIPREIALGCYYDDTLAYQEAWLRGSRPLSSYPGQQQIGRDCKSGSRSRARQAIVSEAQNFYALAANIYFRDDEFSGEELKTLLTKIRDSSYRYNTPGIGRTSLQFLIEYEAENDGSLHDRIEAMIQLADWEMIYASDFGTRFRDAALARYQQAYELASQHGLPADAIASMFSPEIPIRLPSVLPSPLTSPESEPDRGGAYIDVTFVVSTSGKADDIEIVASHPELPRSEERDLVQFIKRSRFRPQFEDGRLMESRPMPVRYYLPE